MSRQRILSKLRKQAWFKLTMALLDELGLDFEILPPTSGFSEAEHYLAAEIRRRVAGRTR